MHVVQLTSAHRRYDTRIFVKECCSIAKSGHTVSLVVADGLGNETKNGVHIYDVGKPKGRIERGIKFAKKVVAKGLELDGDIYHFHDPELLLNISSIKKKGKKVVYDVHENIYSQIKYKYYIPKPLRSLISSSYKLIERSILSKNIDLVVAVNPPVKSLYTGFDIPVIEARNFPSLTEFDLDKSKTELKEDPYLVYIGGLTEARGITQMVKSLEYMPENIRLKLGGPFDSKVYEEKIKNMPGWKKVDYLGYVNRDDVTRVMAGASIGLVLLQPVENYINAYSVKMFEYMASGIPFVGSNYPLWKELIDKYETGIYVDPTDPKAIAEGVMHLLENQEESKRFGENGKKAVLSEYNWENEEKTLLEAYASIL